MSEYHLPPEIITEILRQDPRLMRESQVLNMEFRDLMRREYLSKICSQELTRTEIARAIRNRPLVSVVSRVTDSGDEQYRVTIFRRGRFDTWTTTDFNLVQTVVSPTEFQVKLAISPVTEQLTTEAVVSRVEAGLLFDAELARSVYQDRTVCNQSFVDYTRDNTRLFFSGAIEFIRRLPGLRTPSRNLLVYIYLISHLWGTDIRPIVAVTVNFDRRGHLSNLNSQANDEKYRQIRREIPVLMQMVEASW